MSQDMAVNKRLIKQSYISATQKDCNDADEYFN